MALPELKWQKSKILPQEGEPDLGRVSRPMHTLPRVSSYIIL